MGRGVRAGAGNATDRQGDRLTDKLYNLAEAGIAIVEGVADVAGAGTVRRVRRNSPGGMP
jgi:hypothetical protein